MPRKTTRSTSGSPKPTFYVVFSLVAVMLAAAVYAFQYLNLDFRSDAAGSSDFLQAQGKDLVYKGLKVRLQGANFDNISALGAGIGANNIDRMSIGEADYKMMASLGGNHARLGLSYTWYEKDPAKFFQVVDQHIAWARQNGIWITLLNFVNPDGNDGCYEGYGNSCSFWKNTTEQAQLQNFWIAVASRYANEPVVAGYDLVNEPTPPGPGWCNTWWDLAQKMRNAVAAKAPNQLVFIEACSDPAFGRIFKEADGVTKARNVVYEVHDYDPMRISHPGYNAVNTTAAYPGEATTWINGVQKTLFFDRSTLEGTRYPEYSFAKRFSVEWANKNDVPIYIGEWGAQGWTKGYVQYIRDKAEIYNSLGVSHAYYTWKHDVTSGWRWGVFTRDTLSAPEPEKLAAMKVSFANAFRPNFATGGSMPTSVPAPVTSPVASPKASPVSTPLPTPSPVATKVPTPVPTPSTIPHSTPITTIIPSPVPTTAPTTPVSGGSFPRVLAGNNSKITLTEVKAPSDRNVYIKATFDSSVSGYKVDWYINNRWTTSDGAAPFYLGGDTNNEARGFPLPQGANTVRAVVYYNGQQYIDTTATYAVEPIPSVKPSPIPSPAPVTGNIDIFNEWNSGYCARIVVRNTSNKPVKTWKFSFNLNQASITSKWNASFFNLLGRVTVTPNDNIKYLPANGMNNAADYCASKKGTNWRPTNVSVSYTQ